MLIDRGFDVYLNVSLVVESRAGELVFLADSLAEYYALLEEEHVQILSFIVAGHLRHTQRLLQKQLALRRYEALDSTHTFFNYTRDGEANQSKHLQWILALVINTLLYDAPCVRVEISAGVMKYFAMLFANNQQQQQQHLLYSQ